MTEHANQSSAIAKRLQFHVLGPVRVLDDDGAPIDVGGSKPRLVLVRLLLSPNRAVSTDALMTAVWGEDPPPTARRSLQSHVAKLRAALGGDDGPVRSQSPGYVLAVDEYQIDLWRSEDLVRQARAVLRADPRRAHHLARQARQEWTSEPLADLAAHDQLAPQRQRLDQLWLDLIELEIAAELDAGDTADAVEQLELLVLDRPGHEPFWAELMTAYYRLGRQSDALATFQRARAALLDGFGIDPSPELQRLEMAILGQTAELDYARSPVCPYKGLASYQLDDSHVFHGRDSLVAELLAAVRTASFVVVVGASGVGKSSALRAGLLKALQTQKLSGLRHTSIITPGTAPLRSIYQVPASADVVIVDQFEELFTLTDNEVTQREFVHVLLARVNDGVSRVLISLRADFYGHCTRIPELAALLARRQVVVGPLSEQELRLAITKPAEGVGCVVVPELVDLIVVEAANRPGALPLVSHALVETWQRRVDEQLTPAAYREAGSIAAAIARTAERVYGSLQAEQRNQVEQLFQRLVEPGDGSEDARRKLPYEHLHGSSIDRSVVDRLVDARLLTAGVDGIEIAHEALIEEWPRLRSWIDADRDGIRMHRHLSSAAGAWDELGRDEGELYRGARLSATLSWLADGSPDLSALERDFVEAALVASETQLRQHVRTNRRLRVLLAASLVGVIVAAATTVVAIRKANDAQHGRVAAEAAQLVATIRSQLPNLSSSAVLQLAVAADRKVSTPNTQGLLLDAIAADPGSTIRGDLGTALTLTGRTPISANGGVLVGIDDNALGTVLDAQSLEVEVPYVRTAPTVVVDTGSRLLGVVGTALQAVDLVTGEKIGPPPGVTAHRSQIGLSPDGTTLAVAGATDGSGTLDGVSLYDVASGRRWLTMSSEGHSSIRGVAFSADGRYVLAVVDEITVAVWDTTTGMVVFEAPPAEQARVTRVAMSPSSALVALGREDGRVEMWTFADGHASRLDVHSRHDDDINWIDFDSQSRKMVTTSRDGVAIVWDTKTGEVAAGPQDFEGEGGWTTYFRPDSSTRLVNIGAHGRTWEWELRPGGALATTVAGVNLGATVSASPDTRVLTSSPRGLTFFDPPNLEGHEVPFDSGATRPRGIIASADGTRFAAVYDDGHIELRESLSGALVIVFQETVAASGENMIAVDGNGARIAFQAADGLVEVIDDDGTMVDEIHLQTNRRHLQALDLSDDGTELVISTAAGEAIWYDEAGIASQSIAAPGTGFGAGFVGRRVVVVGGGEAQLIDPWSHLPTRHFALGVNAKRIALDGTGRLLATADETGAIRLWDAASGAPIGNPLQVADASVDVSISFSADGHYMLLSGPAETTWIDVWTADWPRLACSLAEQELSPAERARYLGTPPASGPCS